MKILITGHQGFIGSNAYKHFSSDHTVVGYEWQDAKPDLSQGFDWVLHFGAISSTTERNVEKVMRQNLDFSCWLADQCNSRNINLQYSSSASVYGLNQEFKESSPVDPRSPYAWSKYLFERYVQQKDWNILIQGFRYFNVYGPGEDHKGTQASPFHQFDQQSRGVGKIKVFDHSDQYLRDFVHVDRVISVQQQFLDIPKSGLWNIGTGKTKSFMEIAKDIATAKPSIIEFINMPDELKLSYQKYTCADLTLLNSTLNEKDSS